MRSRLIAAGFLLLTVVLTLSSCNHNGGATPLGNSTPRRGDSLHALLGTQGCTTLAGTRAGAHIKQVSPGGPADKAGLKPGDVVIAADGQVVRSCDQLTAIVQHHVPGDRISVTYHHSGTSHKRTTTVTLGGSGPCPGNVGGICASPVTSSPAEVSGP
jgi:hypothetical protein